jgi:hypothetical protein
MKARSCCAGSMNNPEANMRSTVVTLLLVAAITASAQTAQSLSQTIAGASVANIEVNSGEKTAIVEVLNKSGQDITGFVLAVDAVYSSGRKDHSEYTTD